MVPEMLLKENRGKHMIARVCDTFSWTTPIKQIASFQVENSTSSDVYNPFMDSAEKTVKSLKVDGTCL